MYKNENISYLCNIIISKKLYDDKIKTIPFDIEKIKLQDKNIIITTTSPFKFKNSL